MSKSLLSLWKIIRFLKDDDVQFGKKMLFFIPILYLIFPFDLIGDFFPLAGQLDDVAVFVIMWPILKNLLSAYQDNGYTSQKQGKKREKDAIDIDEKDYEVK